MPASAQQIAKWEDMIEKTLDRMEREEINVNQYLDRLKDKYAIVDEKHQNDNNNNSNNKQISLLVNMDDPYLCNKGHAVECVNGVAGECVGCGKSHMDVGCEKCEACEKYDERYDIKNFDKTGKKYIWCEECMSKTNKIYIKKEISKNDLLIANVTKILNENPQINIDLLCQLKGKTSLEYMLNEICIDKYIHCYSLYTFDVDGFKQINEELGHDGADNILKQIGKILNKMEKTTAKEWEDREMGVDRLFAFRQGGDEFSFITHSNVSDLAAQEGVYLHLKNEINKLGITISVGMCCAGFGPHYLRSAHGLDTRSKWLEYSDKHALYAAKEAGKNTIRIWDNSTTTLVNGFKEH